MVAKGYGSKDTDKVGKEKTDRPMLKASARIPTTGRIGGIANRPEEATRNASEKGGSYPKFRKGGRARGR